MATFTSATLNYDLSTDANYHTLWATTVETFIVANGWTYDAQTGDGDPSSVATGSAGTYPAFRVYSTSVGSETWYVRLDYGHTANGPSLKMQAGSGVNGSGTLTGQTSTQQTGSFGANHAGASQTIFISAASGRLVLWFGAATAGGNDEWSMTVHGGVDATGAMSSGIVQTFNANSQWIPVSGSIPAALTIWPCAANNLSSTTVGGKTITFHPFWWDSTGGQNPNPGYVSAGTSDWAAGVVATITIYGANHNYLMTALTPVSAANQRGGVRYE